MIVVFWAGEGPKLTYQNGFLDINDLNPEKHMRWRLSRWEMLRIGLGFIWAACR